MLNSAKPEFEDYVGVYAIGKFKKTIVIRDIFKGECEFYFPRGTYFVWWGGERNPYSPNGDGISRYDQSDKFGSLVSMICVNEVTAI